MPKIRPHALKHRELLSKLRNFGVIEIKKMGKGSERILILKAGLSGGRYTGPQIPLWGQVLYLAKHRIREKARVKNIAGNNRWISEKIGYEF